MFVRDITFSRPL